MTTLLTACLLLLLFGAPLYLLYWNLFRPVVLKRLQYRLFAVRDELRLLYVEGGIAGDEKAYELTEAFCNRSIAKISDLDMSAVLRPRVNPESLARVEHDIRIIFAANDKIRQSFISAFSANVGAALANSPGSIFVFVPLAMFAVTALWFGKVKLWVRNFATKAVWNICFKPA